MFAEPTSLSILLLQLFVLPLNFLISSKIFLPLRRTPETNVSFCILSLHFFNRLNAYLYILLLCFIDWKRLPVVGLPCDAQKLCQNLLSEGSNMVSPFRDDIFLFVGTGTTYNRQSLFTSSLNCIQYSHGIVFWFDVVVLTEVIMTFNALWHLDRI